MSDLHMILDEGFYQNRPCRMNLKVKINPWHSKGTQQYIDATERMNEFRTKLLALMEEYHDD